MGGKDWRTFGKVHAFLYRLAGGLGVDRMGAGRRAALLTTTGRKSGQLRTTPLVYMTHDQHWIVYPSNGGKETPPAWWLNLQHTPDAMLQVGRRRIEVTARPATEDEYAKIWPIAREYNAHWKGYEQSTRRKIPLVILTTRR